jgi:putative ABC transport system ATP-binding protein
LTLSTVAQSEAAPARTVPPVVVLDRVKKTYRIGQIEVAALRGVSLSVRRGEFLAILGASGSGKSTLMNIVGCLDVPSQGWYRLDGVDVRELDEADLAVIRNRKIGFVFQGFNLIPRTTALANVELVLAYGGMRGRQRRDRAMAALRAVGLEDRALHLPNELSGGQQQRAAIARAIVTNPAMVLADEPTGNLDSVSSAEVMQLFAALHRAGRTIIMITHEADIAAHAERVIRLHDGEIVESYLNPQARPA